jgi:hypothetical protein
VPTVWDDDPNPVIGEILDHRGYFDRPTLRTDRHGVDQIACPRCESMNVFNSRTGKSTKQVKDYRIG